jgi:hypothetical protein
MANLDLYNKIRNVPTEAQKPIGGGRLKGMTDINPMWRIKTLTDQFGPCGFGWYYKILDKRIEDGANGEKSAFVDIELFIKKNDEWSKGIQGTGGSMFVAMETKGLYVSDECFKMALTDAISVACKNLGMGADVYYAKDRTKYDQPTKTKKEEPINYAKLLVAECEKRGIDFKQYAVTHKITSKTTHAEAKTMYEELIKSEDNK